MLDKRYYLGIDGGGSKTAFSIIDETNEVVFKNEVGASALDTVSLQTIKERFLEGIKGFNGCVSGVFAGLGGIVNQTQINEIKEIIKGLPVCDENTKIDAGNDVINALYGGLGGKDGIILIAGTGSVCFGKNKDLYARSGGYCYQEGDAGSGYDLGMSALRHLARVLDGRCEETEFSKDLISATNCNSYETLAAYFMNASRTQVASLSKIVTKHQDNIYAKKIISNGVNEVLEMIKAVFNRLNFTDETVELSVIGSLGNANTLYKEMLLEGLKQISSKIVFVEKRFDADYGSALKAKEV